MVTQIDFLVEERSMEAALRETLPKIIGDIPFSLYPAQCKAALLDKLAAQLKGYGRWLPPEHRVVVVVDRDNEDCAALKQRLEEYARDAGLRTRRLARGGSVQVVNRIVIEELEAWFFGDWDAVRAAYPNVPRNIPERRGFRDPDAIAGGTWEAIERILRNAGYFRNGLRKVEFAASVAEHMDPDRNRSQSFQVFREALMSFVEENRAEGG